MNSIVNFFDKLEDRVRGFLSRRAIAYGFITGIGIVLFWRGVWHTADMLMSIYTNWLPGVGIDLQGAVWWDGPLSFLLGAIMLLLSGTFVSEFIGKEIIISGLTGEKKVSDITVKEVEEDLAESEEILRELKALREDLKNIPRKSI